MDYFDYVKAKQWNYFNTIIRHERERFQERQLVFLLGYIKKIKNVWLG